MNMGGGFDLCIVSHILRELPVVCNIYFFVDKFLLLMLLLLLLFSFSMKSLCEHHN